MTLSGNGHEGEWMWARRRSKRQEADICARYTSRMRLPTATSNTNSSTAEPTATGSAVDATMKRQKGG